MGHPILEKNFAGRFIVSRKEIGKNLKNNHRDPGENQRRVRL
jgi:hypothetical protein